MSSIYELNQSPKPAAVLPLIFKHLPYIPGSYNASDAFGEEMERLGFKRYIRMCISPVITLQLEGVPYKYCEVKIDITRYEGDPTCPHHYVRLYWETGGSFMDSGEPHEHHLCYKCGKALIRPTPISLLKQAWRLFCSK